MQSNQSNNLQPSAYRKFRTSGFEFEVLARYDMQKFCGYGAFGVVTSAVDTITGSTVAIKKIMNAMSTSVKCKQTLREIKMMKLFSHENVTKILDIIPPSPDKLEFDDLYLVEDLMETDLHRVIYSRQELSIDHAQCFVYQILRGLKYLHSANIIHRDLKPSNILVNSNCDIKICDFGLSCLAEDENQLEKTEYVVTRWYRAPEVMLKRQEYTKSIDIWSVGCILAELLAREPLFPGEDYLKQLEIICKKIGKPTERDLGFVTSQRAKEYILSLPIDDPTPHKPFIERLYDLFPKYSALIQHHHTHHHDDSSNIDDDKHDDDDDDDNRGRAAYDVLDMMSKMLRFSPDDRTSVIDALQHPFLESMHNEDDEPDALFHATFKFETENMDGKSEDYLISYYKQLIWDEMREFHPELSIHAPVTSNPLHSNNMHLSPATIAYNYHKSMAAVNGTTTPEQQRQELFITSITPNHDTSASYHHNIHDSIDDHDADHHHRDDHHDMNAYDAGPSSVATVITTKTNLTASNAIHEKRLSSQHVNIAGTNNINHHRTSVKRSQGQGTTTPMSPPTSLPSKRFKATAVP